MIDLKQSPEGVLLQVRVQPGAKRNGIIGVHDGRLKVAVTQAPEKGKANAAVSKVLAAALGLKKSQLELVNGPTSPLKLFLIRDKTVQELQLRLEDLLAD